MKYFLYILRKKLPLRKFIIKFAKIVEIALLSIQKYLILCLLCVIKIYRYSISPMLPRACIFNPSCSEYAIKALTTYNLIKATFFITKRLLKCNSLYKGDKNDPLQ